jgi:uncharacterized protein with PIN domain
MSEAAQRAAATVRVPAELRFLLPPRRRSAELHVALDGVSSLGHLVESLGVPRTEVGTLLVDGEPVPPAYRPRDGDVVDVLPVRRPQRVQAHRYLLDVHLGTLARRLRLLGLDTAYRNDADDADLVVQAERERRVLLTRDRGLLRRRALTAGAYVRGEVADEQVADVLDRFAPPLAPWTRCPACNGCLEAVPVEQVAHQLRPGTLRTYRDFSRCLRCGRAYWRGAHAARLGALVERATSGQPAGPGVVQAIRRRPR